MKSHKRSRSILVLRVCNVVLLMIAIALVFPLAAVQGQQQPPGQQVTPRDFADAPFPLVEEPEIQEFDKLPKEQQVKLLEEEGPLLPLNSNLNNFSMRAFVKGGSPIFIDYALEPNSSAVVRIRTERAEYVLTLFQAPSIREQIRKIQISIPSGDLRDRLIIAGIEALIDRFVLKPEMGRNQVIVDLPREFGEAGQVAKLSIQAFSNYSGQSRPAFFRLYGLAMGEQAIANAAKVPRPTPNLHHRSSAAVGEDRGSTAFDIVKLEPKSIKTNKGESVTYQIHSLVKFNNVKIVFYRVEHYGRVSVSKFAHLDSLGDITAGGWLKPPKPRCVWNGISKGSPSKGIHDVEIRGWIKTDDRYWASAWSVPKRILVE